MVNNQRGFTLVEIAIVLVIIGLLLGGILKGQELVTAARVRNFADQAASVQAAYYGFIDRYRAVPGDMLGTQVCGAIGDVVPNCPPVGVGGVPPPGTGGNGQIDAGNFGEAAAVWAHMTAAGFLRGNYSGVAASAAAYILPGPPLVAPTNPWNGNLLLASTADYMVPAGIPAPPPRLHLIMGRNVPVNIMRELDVKVDDSQPASGILRSAAAAAAAFGAVSGSAATCVLPGPPAIWDINTAAQDCNGYFLY
ncbi:MAG: prepilin-type N-terminal cleavage/methylation domain-containing protein [Candidatus Binatia bacterium]